MTGIKPGDGTEIASFMSLYQQLCPTIDDEVSVEEFSRQLGWPLEQTLRVALWLDERKLIDTDRGMGQEITMIEGRSGT